MLSLKGFAGSIHLHSNSCVRVWGNSTIKMVSFCLPSFEYLLLCACCRSVILVSEVSSNTIRESSQVLNYLNSGV